MTEQTTITDIAHKALAEPKSLTEAEIVRLAAWHVDHDEHISAFQRDTARGSARIERLGLDAQRSPGSAPPSERLAAQQPGSTSMLPLPSDKPATDVPPAADEHMS